MAWSLIKLVAAPILTYVKLVIFSVFKLITGVGGKIFSLAKKGIASGLRDIKSGAKSMVSGFKQVFKPMNKLINKSVDMAYKAFNGISNAAKKVASGLGGFFSRLGKGISGLFSRKPKSQPGVMDDISAPKKGGVLSSIGNKFKNSSFAQGFMKSWNARKEASLKEKAEPIEKAMKDQLVGAGGKKGPLSKIVEAVEGIFKEVKKPEEGGGNKGKSGQGSQMPDV